MAAGRDIKKAAQLITYLCDSSGVVIIRGQLSFVGHGVGRKLGEVVR